MCPCHPLFDGIFSHDKGRWSVPPGDSNGEWACHIEGNSAISLLGIEELTVWVKEDPGMVSNRWTSPRVSWHMQGLKTPVEECGPHLRGGDKSLPSGIKNEKASTQCGLYLIRYTVLEKKNLTIIDVANASENTGVYGKSRYFDSWHISCLKDRCHKIIPWKPSNIIEPQEQPPKTVECGLTIFNYNNDW